MYEIFWHIKYELALAAIGMGTGIYGLCMEWRQRQRVAAMAREFQEVKA